MIGDYLSIKWRKIKESNPRRKHRQQISNLPVPMDATFQFIDVASSNDSLLVPLSLRRVDWCSWDFLPQ